MTRPRVSVPLCTCNGSAYLGEQLRSIARQTVPPDELVICDDASTDSTYEIARVFAAGSNLCVRLFRNSSNLGCTGNYEHSVRLCRGDIIVPADQDDVWKPHRLAAMIRAFRNHPSAAYAFSDAEMINQQGEPLGFTLWDVVGFQPREFIPGRQAALLLRRNLVSGAALAFRSSLLGLVLPIPAGWKNDYWIALLGSIFSYGVPVEERLFLYRRHPAQLSGCGRDSPWQKIKMSLAADPDYRGKAARIAELQERVMALSRTMYCPLAHLQLLQQKRLHLSQRALIRSQHGSARLGSVLNEAVTGRYGRFSCSWSSMIRDLIDLPRHSSA